MLVQAGADGIQLHSAVSSRWPESRIVTLKDAPTAWLFALTGS